jgi:hypothetical protein
LPLYSAALQALVDNNYRVQEADLLPLLTREAAHAAFVLYADSILDPGRILLHRALGEAFEQTRQRVFQLLGLLIDPAKIQDARNYLTHTSDEDVANALEMLDMLLGRSVKVLVLPLFEPLTPEKRCAKLTALFPQDQRAELDVLRQLAAGEPDSLLADWPIRCARYSLAETIRDSPQTDESMHSIVERIIILRSVGIFAETPDSILAEIASVLQERTIQAGDELIQKGTLGDQLYIVVEGALRVHDGDTLLSEIGDRQIVGELAVLSPTPRTADVSALRTTRLFTLDQATLYDLIASRPEVLRGIMFVLIERLRRLTDAVALHN